MKKSIVCVSFAAAALVWAVPATAAECTKVTTSKGSLTAAQVGGDVTGELDATGCQIGVYYSTSTPAGNVSEADISGATYYGVFVDGKDGDVSVNVTDSSISKIGESPPDGAQHGLAVYYYGYETTGAVSGTVSGSSISEYQKGGITVNGEKASVDVMDSTVAGLGEVDFIAQNGIQFGYGATGVASGNTITGNYYTACSNRDAAKTGCTPWVSTGMLLYDVDPAQVKRSDNHYRDNQRNLYVLPTASL